MFRRSIKWAISKRLIFNIVVVLYTLVILFSIVPYKNNEFICCSIQFSYLLPFLIVLYTIDIIKNDRFINNHHNSLFNTMLFFLLNIFSSFIIFIIFYFVFCGALHFIFDFKVYEKLDYLILLTVFILIYISTSVFIGLIVEGYLLSILISLILPSIYFALSISIYSILYRFFGSKIQNKIGLLSPLIIYSIIFILLGLIKYIKKYKI